MAHGAASGAPAEERLRSETERRVRLSMPRRAAAFAEWAGVAVAFHSSMSLANSSMIGASLLLWSTHVCDAFGHLPRLDALDGPVTRRSHALTKFARHSPNRFGSFDFPVFLSSPRRCEDSSGVTENNLSAGFARCQETCRHYRIDSSGRADSSRTSVVGSAGARCDEHPLDSPSTVVLADQRHELAAGAE